MSEENSEFYRAYDRLSNDGHCDGPGGCEYTRVKKEWETLGCPRPLDTFIVVLANVGPDGKGKERLN